MCFFTLTFVKYPQSTAYYMKINYTFTRIQKKNINKTSYILHYWVAKWNKNEKYSLLPSL